MAITTTTIAILTAASTIFSVAGSIFSGISAGKQAEAQAEIARQQAERERQVSKQKETDFRKRQRRAASAVRAAGGARGIDVSVGSPLLSAQDFIRETERQALRIREGGEVRATRLEQQAELLRFRAGSLRASGFFGAGTSLLKGGARTARILS